MECEADMSVEDIWGHIKRIPCCHSSGQSCPGESGPIPRRACPAGTITLNPRWIHVMAWRCFHVDIWFYLKIESTSVFPRWFHVIFSTLIPRVFHVESTCFQRWINVMFSTLNQRQDPTWFPRWYLVLYESWFHVQFSTLNLRNVLNVEST